MSHQPPWIDEVDEAYWTAIVTQGRWSDSAYPELPRAATSTEPLTLRVTSSELDRRWAKLDEQFNEGAVLCLPVTGYNKGGLLVDWEGMQGFVPISQLPEAPTQRDECARMDYLAEHVGQELKVKIIELDRSQNRIIYSQRAARWGECCPDSLLDTLVPGDVCQGDVSNLCDFGVFVDLGGVDGLIHVSELSWRRVNHPRDVLHVGQRIHVHVIDVDHDRRRIALSLKRLQPNPWATVAERYHPGMVVMGKITNVVDFGAFARIEDGVEGLIHVSELTGSSDDPNHPGKRIEEGCVVPVRILSVDPENQRMGLSLRGVQAAGDEAVSYNEEAPAGSDAS
jgi:small subunit ribosomal protein S1